MTEENARTIREKLSSHLLGKAREWFNKLDEVIQAGLTAHYNEVEAWCSMLQKRFPSSMPANDNTPPCRYSPYGKSMSQQAY